MIGKTLGMYISIRFLRSLLAMVLGLAFLIIAVDFIELLKRSSNYENVSLLALYGISALRAPVFIEKAFPFACLFAAMMTLTQMNSKMELVVARAAGISAWQFLLPISLSAALVGVLVATLYNPLAVAASHWAKDLTAKLFYQQEIPQFKSSHNHWIKQIDGDGGHTIFNAALSRKNGQQLTDVKILRFDSEGLFLERIDAKSVDYEGDHWKVSNLKKTSRDGVTVTEVSENLSTSLTIDQLLGFNGKPDEISIWNLRKAAKSLEKTGTSGNAFLVHFHSLTALPTFFFAMILVAAGVCLRFVRFGQVGRMILGGIFFGFVLYTLTNLIMALGSNGVIPPIMAAWSPGIVAILFGISVLLYQEDG